MTETQCRRIVRARSRGICESCLTQRATDASHRKPRSQGGLWAPENITHACRRCHAWQEANPGSAHDLGWRLWRAEDPAATPFLLGGHLPVLLTPDGQYLRLDMKENAS